MIIGRSADCDIRLDKTTVSRQHAELFRDPFGRWWIRDLGSRNGIRVGEQRVGERALRPGDAVGIGEFVVRFQAAQLESRPASTLTIVPASDAAAQIFDIEQMETPRIAAEHLSVLIEFGRELLDIEEPAHRHEKLCRLMLKPEFGGRFSLVVRAGAVPGNVVAGPFVAAEGDAGPHISQRLLDSVRHTGHACLASSRASSPDVVQMTIAAPVAKEAAAACPLDFDPEPHVLYVGFPPERGTAEWLAVTSLAAEQFRAAESAWAARRQAQAHAAIEQELQQARRLQLRLVPRDLQLTGLELEITFRPCRWVGGDYVGARALPDGRVLLTVADVCGKGLAAALVASSLHTMLFASLRTGAVLAEVMNALNAYFIEVMDEGSFVTMSCILLDPVTGRLECANAGHPPPLVIGPDGNVRQLPSAENCPLGIVPDSITCREQRLESGELLAMYSDGLSELHTPDGQMLGIEGFAEELKRLYALEAGPRLAGVSQALDLRLDELQRGRLAQDDITLLMARRTG